jgi:hypothetical protein
VSTKAGRQALVAREQNRLANVRQLIRKAGSIKAFAASVNAAPSTISQYAGPNPTRRITENMARGWEVSLGLREGELDRPPRDKVTVEASPATPRRRASDALAPHLLDLSKLPSATGRALVEKMVVVCGRGLLPEARVLELLEEMAALER